MGLDRMHSLQVMYTGAAVRRGSARWVVENGVQKAIKYGLSGTQPGIPCKDGSN